MKQLLNTKLVQSLESITRMERTLVRRLLVVCMLVMLLGSIVPIPGAFAEEPDGGGVAGVAEPALTESGGIMEGTPDEIDDIAALESILDDSDGMSLDTVGQATGVVQVGEAVDLEGVTRTDADTIQGVLPFTLDSVVQCKNVQNGDPVTPTRVYAGTDSAAYTWVKLTNVSAAVRLRVVWYRPNGAYYAHAITGWVQPPAGGGAWSWVKLWAWIPIQGYAPANLDGEWVAGTDIETAPGGGWIAAGTRRFTISFKFIDREYNPSRPNVTARTIATGITPALYPVQPGTDAFVDTSQRAVSWLLIENVAESLTIRWEWVAPAGHTYATYDQTTPAPAPNSAYNYRTASWIPITGAPAASMPGQWRVRVFIRGVTGVWQRKHIGSFTVRQIRRWSLRVWNFANDETAETTIDGRKSDFRNPNVKTKVKDVIDEMNRWFTSQGCPQVQFELHGDSVTIPMENGRRLPARLRNPSPGADEDEIFDWMNGHLGQYFNIALVQQRNGDDYGGVADARHLPEGAAIVGRGNVQAGGDKAIAARTWAHEVYHWAGRTRNSDAWGLAAHGTGDPVSQATSPRPPRTVRSSNFFAGEVNASGAQIILDGVSSTTTATMSAVQCDDFYNETGYSR